jgi:hypothetical protein
MTMLCKNFDLQRQQSAAVIHLIILNPINMENKNINSLTITKSRKNPVLQSEKDVFYHNRVFGNA